LYGKNIVSANLIDTRAVTCE